MRGISDLVFRLRALFRPATMEHELDDEIAFHLEMATAKNVERGMDPDEARRAAEASFGNLTRHKQLARDSWGLVLLQELRGDGRFAVRQMLRRPSSALLAAMVLGLGIGGTVALWSAVHGLLLRSLPYTATERLVVLWSDGDWPVRTAGPSSSIWNGSSPTLGSLPVWPRALQDCVRCCRSNTWRSITGSDGTR